MNKEIIELSKEPFEFSGEPFEIIEHQIVKFDDIPVDNDNQESGYGKLAIIASLVDKNGNTHEVLEWISQEDNEEEYLNLSIDYIDSHIAAHGWTTNGLYDIDALDENGISISDIHEALDIIVKKEKVTKSKEEISQL